VQCPLSAGAGDNDQRLTDADIERRRAPVTADVRRRYHDNRGAAVSAESTSAYVQHHLSRQAGKTVDTARRRDDRPTTTDQWDSARGRRSRPSEPLDVATIRRDESPPYDELDDVARRRTTDVRRRHDESRLSRRDTRPRQTIADQHVPRRLVFRSVSVASLPQSQRCGREKRFVLINSKTT